MPTILRHPDTPIVVGMAFKAEPVEYDLNTLFSFFNATKADDANLMPYGTSGSKFVNASVSSSKLAGISVTGSKLESGVATLDKIKNKTISPLTWDSWVIGGMVTPPGTPAQMKLRQRLYVPSGKSTLLGQYLGLNYKDTGVPPITGTLQVKWRIYAALGGLVVVEGNWVELPVQTTPGTLASWKSDTEVTITSLTSNTWYILEIWEQNAGTNDGELEGFLITFS